MKFLKSLQQLIAAPANMSSLLKNVCAKAIESSRPSFHLMVCLITFSNLIYPDFVLVPTISDYRGFIYSNYRSFIPILRCIA